jgi:hypothetical protein
VLISNWFSKCIRELEDYIKSIYRVLLKYRLTGFAPISHKDPVVLSQCSNKIEDRQIAANKNIF